MQELFKPYGNVVYVSIPKFRVSQKPKGFAFFEFDNEASVAAVMKVPNIASDYIFILKAEM